MSYQTERDQFIAHVSREGAPYRLIVALLREATTLQRLSELSCSSEAANRDTVPCPGAATRADGVPCLCDKPHTGHENVPRIDIQAYRSEQRAIKATRISRCLCCGTADDCDHWGVVTNGDPRGYVLAVIPPSYAQRNKGRDRSNLDGIGVPARPSRLQF